MGDELSIAVETPPQTARHQGYETAFVEMPDVDLVVPEAWTGAERDDESDDTEGTDDGVDDTGDDEEAEDA